MAETAAAPSDVRLRIKAVLEDAGFWIAAERYDRLIERLAEAAAPPALDEAWAEAVAALPDGWTLSGVQAKADPGSSPFQASHTPMPPISRWGAGALALDWSKDAEAFGPTPAAALHALAAKLRAASPAASS